MALDASNARRARRPVQVGTQWLRTAGELLRHHWLPLLLIAAGSLVVQHYLFVLVIWIARSGAVPGLLGLSLVPFVPMLAVVGMLLVLRRRQRGQSPFADMLAAVASVLVPFLVVYQGTGGLDADFLQYTDQGIQDDFARAEPGEISSVDRIPVGDSLIVVAVVLAALAMRSLGSRVVYAKRMWRQHEDPRRLALQIGVGYAEVVWIVLGAFSITYVVRQFRSWWESRVAARWFEGILDRLEVLWPMFGDLAPWLSALAGYLLAGAIAALLVPIAWLAIGVIVYGVQAADALDIEDLERISRSNKALKKLTGRVGMDTITRAWRLLSEPGGKFGAMLGAGLMILRTGWIQVLMFCLAYLLIAQIPTLVWTVVAQLAPPLGLGDWRGLAPLVDTVAQVPTLVLSAVVLAVGADALLSQFGAPSWLRLPGRGEVRLVDLPRPEPAQRLSAEPPAVPPMPAPDPGRLIGTEPPPAPPDRAAPLDPDLPTGVPEPLTGAPSPTGAGANDARAPDGSPHPGTGPEPGAGGSPPIKEPGAPGSEG